MVLLPSLVLGSEVERAGVLEVRGQNHGLVTGFTGKLDTQVPSIEGDEDEVEVVADQVLGCESVESVDCVSERSRISYMFPCQGC